MTREKSKGNGITIHGKEIEVNNEYGVVLCEFKELIEVRLPKTFEEIYCNDNQLTKLKLPKNVKEVHCYNNNLKEINLPDSVLIVNCVNNPIKQITLPKNIEKAWLPKGCEILNLDSKKIQERKLEIYFK